MGVHKNLLLRASWRWSCRRECGASIPIKLRRCYAASAASWSSSNRNQDHQAFQNTYGLPFTVGPDDALDKFRSWAANDQGLSQWLLGRHIGITAAYCPVWTFDLNVKFVLHNKATGRTTGVVPTAFGGAYAGQTVLHLPGLSAYAGYTYRRTLVDPVHATSILFLGHDQLSPFHSYMLRDMKLRDGNTLTVFPDPWNATQGRALQVVKRLLLNMAASSSDAHVDGGAQQELQLKTELVRARRVYLPTYIIDYRVLGAHYQAIVSGYDTATPVSGISHTLLDSSSTTVFQSFTTTAGAAAYRLVGIQNLASALSILVQLVGSLAARLVLRIPLVAAVGGVFVGFRKVIRPWMDNRAASAEWERQRDHEALTPNTAGSTTTTADDFTDVAGAAERYFQANRTRILRSLGGEETHERGTFDWYSAWEQWSRQQWEQQQQQQQQQQTYGQQQYGQQRSSQQRGQRRSSHRGGQGQPRQEFKWDFDPTDPYSVLGIRRGASMKEVSAAFRKQMVLHHPDTKANASDAERSRAEERSKLITNAYQSIKASLKR